MTDVKIKEFLQNNNYDLRINKNNGRWIDQKCTPDVLWSISDFVINYVENIKETFTVSDIWQSEYAKQTIKETFSKPDTDDKSAENEYDKVFSQPLCLLCYANVIQDIGIGNRHLYKVNRKDILEYIARNDVYSLRFLTEYIEKVLKDSNLYWAFEDFFDIQTKNAYENLKANFINFYHKYTPIKGKYEPKRIFTKVVNPLAFKYKKHGTERGRLSPDIINRSDMMYNRDNFRDVYRDKPKGMTRKDWLNANPKIDIRVGYFEQMMNSSKRMVRGTNDVFRGGISELTQFNDAHNDNAPATQIHHIFPKSEHPEIMHYLENLIALTPNQHYGFAHPNNNTQIIDIDAQKVLLIAKTYSVKKNIEEELDKIYSFENLLYVLNNGWDDDTVMEIDNGDYNSIIHTINYHY